MRPRQVLSGAIRWCLARWTRRPVGRVLRVNACALRHTLLALEEDGAGAAVAVLPSPGSAQRKWKIVHPSGVGSRVLARCRLPGVVSPRDFGLPCIVAEDGAQRWFFGPDDDVSSLLQQP